jgi:hypothetical protein
VIRGAVSQLVRLAVSCRRRGDGWDLRSRPAVGDWSIVDAVSESQEMTVLNDTGVTLTPAAVAKALALLSQEGRADLRLRIAVQPGGCAGLRYNLFFDDRLLNDDIVTIYRAPEDPSPGNNTEEDTAHEGQGQR